MQLRLSGTDLGVLLAKVIMSHLSPQLSVNAELDGGRLGSEGETFLWSHIGEQLKPIFDRVTVREWPSYAVVVMETVIEHAERVVLIDPIQCLAELSGQVSHPPDAFDKGGSKTVDLPPIGSCLRPSLLLDSPDAGNLSRPILFEPRAKVGSYQQFLPLGSDRTMVRYRDEHHDFGLWGAQVKFLEIMSTILEQQR